MAIYLIRWVSLPQPLPANWTPGKLVRFTARVISEPYHTDTKTIVSAGRWKIELKGYQDLILGEKYTFIGTPVPELLMGKITKIVMTDPTIEHFGRSDMRPAERLLMRLVTMRVQMVKKLRSLLPEPESTLGAGILLGVSKGMSREFYDALVQTGTLHTVAASGYNVTVVGRVALVPLLHVAGRGLAVGVASGAIFLYVLLAGGSASVVRAGIMGILTLIAYYVGRPTEAKRLLFVAAGLMLLVDPLIIADIGFQLSVSATLGLLYLEPVIQKYGPRNGWLSEYLYPTLAASAATLPVTLWTFGRVSWMSPLINMLVLPLVSPIMLLTSLTVVTGWIPGVGYVMSWLSYVPLHLFTRIVEIAGSW